MNHFVARAAAAAAADHLDAAAAEDRICGMPPGIFSAFEEIHSFLCV